MSNRRRKQDTSSGTETSEETTESSTASSSSMSSETTTSSSEDRRRRRKKKRAKKVTKKRKRGGKKKNKGPKRPVTAYSYFLKEVRPSVVAEQEDTSFGAVSKTVAARWKKLTEEEKQPYKDLNETDKVRYEKEKEEWEANKPESSSSSTSSSSSSGRPRKKRKRSKKPVDPDKPKRPRNSYLYFAIENRARIAKEHPDIEGTAITKKVGAIWTAMTKEEQKPYIDRAAEDRERYTEEMKVYNEGKGGD
eukprot:TRINITY_DN2876_c0_g1_i1.p1 TRINITY_DN2876_c0_g1~~TRINITY_DN2876_c0_g1_i1.p1  ORF type:complete len:249 (-),score=92.35 TRINITY_DN2876_c0_g1_i1:79-825(-)